MRHRADNLPLDKTLSFFLSHDRIDSPADYPDLDVNDLLCVFTKRDISQGKECLLSFIADRGYGLSWEESQQH